MKFIFISVILLAPYLHAETNYTHKESGVMIHVVEFSVEENVGFEFVSSDCENLKFAASDYYKEEAHSFIINGGYFDGNLKPVGFCQIDGEVLSSEELSRLSGFITTTESGEVALHWKAVPEGEFRDIVQSGPFVIDPGGEIGIRSRSGNPAKRTLIGMTADQSVVILTTTEVYLYDLAKILKQQMPELERVLNLDGGPSVALIYGDTRNVNSVPVSNFLRKRK